MWEGSSILKMSANDTSSFFGFFLSGAICVAQDTLGLNTGIRPRHLKEEKLSNVVIPTKASACVYFD